MANQYNNSLSHTKWLYKHQMVAKYRKGLQEIIRIL